MVDDDSIQDDSASAVVPVEADLGSVDGTVAPKKRRRRRKRKSPSASVSESELVQEPVSEPELAPEPIYEPPAYDYPVEEPAPEPVYEPIPEPAPAPEPVYEPTPESVPALQPIYEPAPESVYEPPTYDYPAPEPVAIEPASPFDLASEPTALYDPISEPILEPMPEPPMPPPYEPSPFDLATSYDNEKSVSSDSDPFADYQTPFGGSHKSESMSEPEPEPQPQHSEPVEEIYHQGEEPIEGEVVEEIPLHNDPEPMHDVQALGVEGSFKERFEELLHEANLTPRHLKFCCGGLVGVAFIVVAGFWAVPKILTVLDNSETPVQEEAVPPGEEAENEEAVVVPNTPPVEDVAPPILPTNEPVWVDASLYSGLQLGDPLVRLEGATGPDSGIFVASEEEFQAREEALHLEANLDRFVFFIEDIEGLYNLYTLDLSALLDASNNRTQALDNHIDDLHARYNAAVGFYEEAQQIKTEFSESFNVGEPLKEAYQMQFFGDVKAYRGAKAIEVLNDFVEQSQLQVDTKAKYYAFSKVQGLYEWILPPFKNRISDIEINREALISGVQVVDVLNSDLDLILGEEDLGSLGQ